MTEESSGHRGARTWWWIAAAAILVAGLVWVVVANLPGGAPAAGPATSATASPGQFTTPVPEPSVAPPTATGTPTVVPTKKPTAVETGLDDKVEPSPGITASVAKIEAVDGEARGPGEIAGPALRVTINLTNGTDEAIRTELGLINVYYGKDRTPAGTLSGPGVAAFPAQIAAGASGTGTSVFNVPTSQRDHIEVEFSYSTDVPVVIFSGAV